MDLKARKHELIRKLFKVEESGVLDRLEEVLNEDIANEDITRYNTELDKGIREIENGEFYTQEEVKAITEKW